MEQYQGIYQGLDIYLVSLFQLTVAISNYKLLLMCIFYCSISTSRYEDLLQDPNTHLKNILRGRGITVGAIDVTSVRQHELYNHEEKECFNIFTPTLYSKTIRKLNTRLEKKIGYNHIVNKTKQIEEQCVSLYIWNFFMDLLWWIIVPTMVFLFSFAFYLSIAGASKRYHQSRQRSKQKTCYISADKGLKKD